VPDQDPAETRKQLEVAILDHIAATDRESDNPIGISTAVILTEVYFEEFGTPVLVYKVIGEDASWRVAGILAAATATNSHGLAMQFEPSDE